MLMIDAEMRSAPQMVDGVTSSVRSTRSTAGACPVATSMWRGCDDGEREPSVLLVGYSRFWSPVVLRRAGRVWLVLERGSDDVAPAEVLAEPGGCTGSAPS
jgi:hypothetical protein